MADETPIFSVTMEAVSDMMGRLTQNMDEQRRFRDDMQLYFQHQSRIDRARNEQLKKSGSLWKNIKSNADDTYKIMLKMGKLGIGIGGGALGLGAAGVYGYGRMAAGVGDERRQAMGLGSTIGQMKSFETNMKRIFKDPLAFLSEAQTISQLTNPESYRLRKLTGMAGIGDDEYINTPIADLIVKTLPTMKKIVDSFDDATMKQIGNKDFRNQSGLGILNEEQARILRALKSEEIPEMQKTYFAGKTSMDMVDENARKLQDLDRRFNEVLTNIYQSFKNDVVPLAKPLGDLAKASEHAVIDMINSGTALKAVEGAAEGLDKVLKYIGSPEAQVNMEMFIDGISELGETIYHLNHPMEYAEQQFNQKMKDTVGKSSLFNSYLDTLEYFVGGNQDRIKRDAILDVETNGRDAGAVSPTGAMGAYQVTIGNMRRNFPQYANELPFLKNPNQASESEKAHLSEWAKNHQSEIKQVGEKLLDEALTYAKGNVGEAYKIYNMGLGGYQSGNISEEAKKGAAKALSSYQKRMAVQGMIAPGSAGKMIGGSFIPKAIEGAWDYIKSYAPTDIWKPSTNDPLEFTPYLKKYDPTDIWKPEYGDPFDFSFMEEEKKKKQVVQTQNGNINYGFSKNDVKRIELGVKVGSRPGGDVFGQAVAMS